MSYSNPANINIIATENALNQNSNELAAELLIGFALNCENRDELEALCQKILVDTPLEIQCAAILALSHIGRRFFKLDKRSLIAVKEKKNAPMLQGVISDFEDDCLVFNIIGT